MSGNDYYKSYDDKDFSDILQKKEFNINIKKKAKYIYQEPIQLILKNYISKFTPYDNILLYHQMGSGKTCSAITIAEGFKEYITKVNRKIIVLVKNKNIEKNFINELVSNCTMGDYESVYDDESLNKLRRRINANYEIITYGNFVNRVFGNKMYTLDNEGNVIYEKDESGKIKRKKHDNFINNLNDTVIIVDEVHNITYNDTYHALYETLNKSLNYRLILLTATPIYDNIKEIAEISNLLNIKEKSNLLPIRNSLIPQYMKPDTKNNLLLKTPILYVTDYGMEKITNAMKGKVSYLSANIETYPERIDVGTKLYDDNGSKEYVFCEMSEYQYKIYKKALSMDTSSKLSDLDEILNNENLIESDNEQLNMPTSSGLYKNSSDASTMVYPENTFGKIGFEKLKNDNSCLILNENDDNSGLKYYSNKLATLLKNVKNSTGNIFIYSNYVNFGGIQLVRRILLANGFVKYNPNSSNPKSFVIYDDQLTAEKRDKIRKVFNSNKNKNGDIIKIILGSPIMSEGITLKNIRQVHILEPYWNMSKINQIIGRAIRNHSHDDLKDDERNVKIFKYISTYKKDKNILYIDNEKYKLSEYKDRSNKMIEFILKQISFDCFINKERNQEYNDKYLDNSAECDYRECNIKCLYEPGNLNRLIEGDKDIKNTYNINIRNFEKYAIFYIKQQVQLLFKLYFVWHLNEIIEKIKRMDSTINVEAIYIALNDLVSNKTTIMDMYNRKGYIITKGEYYIFNPENMNIDSSIYNKIYDFTFDANNTTFEMFIKNKQLLKESKKEIEPKKEKQQIKKYNLSKSDKLYNEEIKSKYKIYGSFRSYKEISDENPDGIIDNTFRIIDQRLISSETRDKRKNLTGQACPTIKKDKLIDILNYLINNEIGVNIEKIKLDENSLKQLSVSYICNIIQNYLSENKRILK